MRKVTIIGIGAGDPEHVTVQAIGALDAADVFFVVIKAAEQQDLVDLRREILQRYANAKHRVVEVRDPERRRGDTAGAQREAIVDWRAARAEQYTTLIRDELGDEETGAFLAWGDPSLYESVLTILRDLAARGSVAFGLEVVPGISAVSALAARHCIPLNQVGGAVQVTTGRRLAATGMPVDADDVVVMLDPDCSFTKLLDDDLDIYWGAYVGTEDELLVAGRLADVADEIVRTRAEARSRKGWMFDTYLLRRTAAP